MVSEHPTPRPSVCVHATAAQQRSPPPPQQRSGPCRTGRSNARPSGECTRAEHKALWRASQTLLLVCLMLYADPSRAHDAGTAHGKAPVTEVRAV